MKWTKLTIDTTCEAEDLISAFLEAFWVFR